MCVCVCVVIACRRTQFDRFRVYTALVLCSDMSNSMWVFAIPRNVYGIIESKVDGWPMKRQICIYQGHVVFSANISRTRMCPAEYS